jgi:hypothetical protein
VPTGASDNGDRATIARSAAVVTGPPGITDDGLEWFIPLPGRGNRRPVQVGEHLPTDHPLVLAYPAYFTPSQEPVDCWPLASASLERRKRQQADRMRLASHPCRKVTPACARCGAESPDSVVLFDQPRELDLIAELSGLDDHDADRATDGWAIEARYAAMARVWQEQTIELQRAEGAWRAEHQQCPEGTEPMPAPQLPERPALHLRLSGVRTLT